MALLDHLAQSEENTAMRKLKLQVHMTVDGYIAGPQGGMDWTNHNWDNELKRYVGEITQPVDGIVLGRTSRV